MDGGFRASMARVKLLSEIGFGMNWLVYRFYVAISSAWEEILMWFEVCKKSLIVIESLEA